MILLSQSCKTRTLIIPEYRRFVILITAILITRILSLNNANTINSPCNNDFNVSLGIHVQNSALLLAAVSVNVGDGNSCGVSTWIDRVAIFKRLFWRKLNKLSENFSLYSKLVFKMWPFKNAFFVLLRC